MNWKFWQGRDEDEAEEEQPQAAPVPAVVPSKADLRAQRLAATPPKGQAPTSWEDELPESGDRFERWLIKTMHQAGPILITLLVGASTGYFMSDFSTTLTLGSAIGYGGGFTIALIECALVFKKRLAGKAGDDEQAFWLLMASPAFGAASIITQIVFLQHFLSNNLADASVLQEIPVLGIVVGVMGGPPSS